jgi:hypothetical protein
VQLALSGWLAYMPAALPCRLSFQSYNRELAMESAVFLATEDGI